MEMIDESGLQQARVLGLKTDSSKFVLLQAGGKGDRGKGTGRANRDRARTWHSKHLCL